MNTIKHYWQCAVPEALRRRMAIMRGYVEAIVRRSILRLSTSKAIYRANTHSLLGKEKLSTIDRCLRKVRCISGATAEVGVYRGGSAFLIASGAPRKDCYLFDTFEGMPIKGESDVHDIGDFKDTNLSAVKQLLSGCRNVYFKVGFFPNTTKGLDQVMYSFVHIDGDQYETTKAALEYFYPRMNNGGIMVFDDYDWPLCPGVKTALQEFLQDKHEILEYPQLYQAIITKNASLSNKELLTVIN